MNELVIANHEIQVQEGRFELIGYDDLLKQVEELGRYLATIEVTPENVKDNKKLVAQVRKMTDNLNKERIEFKKLYLRPVTFLEGQVKDLTEKVKEYESLVRVQIRELEEKERKEKQEAIHELFKKRQRAYGGDGLYPFDDFLKPQHLNKSTTMGRVEKEMVDWFEKRQSDLRILTDFAENSAFDKTEVISNYLKVGDLNNTLQHYNDLLKQRVTLEQALDENSKKDKHITGYNAKKGNMTSCNAKSCNADPEMEDYILIAIKESDRDRVVRLLNMNGIKFDYPALKYTKKTE